MSGLVREEAIRRIAEARAAGIGEAERAAWLFDAACDTDAGLSPELVRRIEAEDLDDPALAPVLVERLAARRRWAKAASTRSASFAGGRMTGRTPPTPTGCSAAQTGR